MWNISLPVFRTQYVTLLKSGIHNYNVHCKVENDNIVGVLLQTPIHHFGKQFVLRLNTRWRDGSCSHKNCYLNCSYMCVKCHNESKTIPPPSVGARKKTDFQNGG